MSLKIVTSSVSHLWSLTEQFSASETPVFLVNYSELVTQQPDFAGEVFVRRGVCVFYFLNLIFLGSA